MNEQNPLIPLRDLELSSREGRHQLPSPGAPPPPPPPAATTKQSLEINAPPPPANDGSQRREFARKPMPFGGVAPVGEMAGPEGQKWHISLWDVSMGGLCVVVDSPMDEPFGTSFAISVYEIFGLGSAFFNSRSFLVPMIFLRAHSIMGVLLSESRSDCHSRMEWKKGTSPLVGRRPEERVGTFGVAQVA